MQVLYERCAAVDVGKDVIAVAVRLPGDGPDGRATVKRTFKTFYGVLGAAARWLTGQEKKYLICLAPIYHSHSSSAVQLPHLNSNAQSIPQQSTLVSCVR